MEQIVVQTKNSLTPLMVCVYLAPAMPIYLQKFNNKIHEKCTYCSCCYLFSYWESWRLFLFILIIENTETQSDLGFPQGHKAMKHRTRVRCRFCDSEKHRQTDLESAKSPCYFQGSFETIIYYSILKTVNSWCSSLDRVSCLPHWCVSGGGGPDIWEKECCLVESSVGWSWTEKAEILAFAVKEEKQKQKQTKNQLVKPQAWAYQRLAFNKIPNISKSQ